MSLSLLLPTATTSKFICTCMLLAGLALMACPQAAGQDLVYQPRNPAFGGSPLNYQWMLNSAQVQNAYEDDDDRFDEDPLDDFQESLQRRILSELSRELVQNRFGDDLDLTQEGRFDLGDFVIEITPGIDGVAIRIFNVLTGAESTVTIPTF